MKLTKKTNKAIEEIEDRYRNLDRIFPDQEYDGVYNMVAQLRWLFLTWTGGKQVLNDGTFDRKAWNFEIVKKHMQKIELRFLFQKATGNAKFIDFYDFPKLIT